MLKQTDATLKAWLQRAVAAGGPYDPASLFLGVYTAIVDNGAATDLADVTEGTGDLATRQAISAWGTPYKMVDGRWVVDAAAKTFRVADETEAQIVTGYFLASLVTAGVLKAWDNLATPANLEDEDRAVTIAVRLSIDPLGRFSITQTWNG